MMPTGQVKSFAKGNYPECDFYCKAKHLKRSRSCMYFIHEITIFGFMHLLCQMSNACMKLWNQNIWQINSN